jgi:hypothetical protein
MFADAPLEGRSDPHQGELAGVVAQSSLDTTPAMDSLRLVAHRFGPASALSSIKAGLRCSRRYSSPSRISILADSHRWQGGAGRRLDSTSSQRR